MTALLVFLAAVVAFSLSALCGGGAGLLLLPLLGLYLPVAQAPAALSIGTFSSSAARLYVFYKQVNFKIVRLFLPAALPAVVAGTLLLRYINPLYLGLIMGLFLVSNIAFLFRRDDRISGRKPPSRLQLLLIGFSAGFLSGLTGAVGLLFNRFYFKYGLTKEEVIATRAANEILLHLLKLILYFALGLLQSDTWLLGGMVALAGIVSSFVLRQGLRFISETVFRRMGYTAMVVSGCLMLGRSFGALNSGLQPAVAYSPVPKNKDAVIRWRATGIAIEFSWNDGLEYEVPVPLSALTATQRLYIYQHKGDADLILIEEVYELSGKVSFEAYYYKKDILIRKFDF